MESRYVVSPAEANGADYAKETPSFPFIRARNVRESNVDHWLTFVYCNLGLIAMVRLTRISTAKYARQRPKIRTGTIEVTQQCHRKSIGLEPTKAKTSVEHT